MEAKPSLGEVIERIGLGRAHLKAAFLGGGTYLADGAELLLISSVTESVAEEWGLSPMQKGFGVTIVFCGMLIGNLSAGPLGDSLGRKLAILLSYAGVFVFSLASSFSPNYVILIILRCVVGIAIGIGIPVWNSLCVEITPAPHRMIMQCGSQILFSVGELYSAMLIFSEDPSMEHLQWRLLLRLGAIPSLVLGVGALFFLPQSPSFLSINGRHEDAKKVLQAMKDENNPDEDFSVDFEPAPPIEEEKGFDTLKRQCGIVFGPSRLYTTLVLIYGCCSLNIMLYGSLYAFPQVLPSLHMSASPAMELFLGALMEAPGILLGFVMSVYMKRIPMMAVLFAIIACFMALFAFLINLGFDDQSVIVLTTVVYYCIKIFPTSLFLVTYQYVAEYYPTEVRSTGAGFAIGGGRLGAMCSPLIIEEMEELTGTYATFFYFVACISLAAVPLIAGLPKETKDVKLSDRDEQDEEPKREKTV